ncbi:VOC family protein [Mycobacterium arosiense]|uniref:Biphenyl 2,3-dioxygenase n=1 Tax=Mycobacterium arosiense ATCC BAA-1401 = DSM 45069 TaxID=1265311 RepID=A0A1W9ZH54_MYCAI|nr:VOC family protein [Mycobacterium arosiense]ORA15181.1 biphenyl 2,3-dioxygenase [Mycobacterium arosiense ATCC BAA-1401 = DSM 45069]
MQSPSKLSHIVLQTNRVREMRDWYTNVLAAKVAFENDALCFLSYDDEHHRIGLVSFGDYTERSDDALGLHHVSFTYASLAALLENFERLAAEDIQPVMKINHGPTISLYYCDPDRNRVELQVDVFASNEEVNAFINGPIYQTNPIGTEFDPAEMLANLRAGVSVAELVQRTE